MGPLPWQGLNLLFSEKVAIGQSSSQCPGLSVCAVIDFKVDPKGNHPRLSSTFVWEVLFLMLYMDNVVLAKFSICGQLGRVYFFLINGTFF